MTKPQPLQPDFGALAQLFRTNKLTCSIYSATDVVTWVASELDSSHLFQVAEVDVANIDISHCDLDQTAVPALLVDSSTSVPSQDNNTEQQHCPPELALHAVELSLCEDVLAKYKSTYAHSRSMNKWSNLHYLEERGKIS